MSKVQFDRLYPESDNYFVGKRDGKVVVELLKGRARWWVISDTMCIPYEKASQAVAFAKSAAHWC